jgi:hypothetical protein
MLNDNETNRRTEESKALEMFDKMYMLASSLLFLCLGHLRQSGADFMADSSLCGG